MKGLRWSATADCPRKAVYGATVEPDRDWSDREQRILYRGRSIGADYADWLERTHGPDNVQREVKVEWEFGVGHIDVFLPEQRVAVEVLSSAFATGAMVERKLLQLVGYMESFPAADSGLLVIVNPSDFSEDRWPLVRDSDTYRGLVEAMRERVAALREWKQTRVLPGRVCRKPADAIGHFCRYAASCFEGWEPPAPESVVADPDAIRLTGQLLYAKGEEQRAKRVATAREQERKEIEQQLADLPGIAEVKGEITVGPFTVKRSFTRRSATLDVKKAEAAGALNVEWLSEFMRPGAEYWTTQVVRAAEGVEPEWGDVPW